MSDLHKALTKDDVKKIQWCTQIAIYLSEECDWDFHEAYEYAEVLHCDYVELSDDYEADPIETLKEDMTYWGD
jgi:hypothetical protein